MKIYQALKKKNELAGEIKAIEQLLMQKNSRITTEKNRVDLPKKEQELTEKREELIDLKAKIATANLPIQRMIFELSELKASHKFYSVLSTKEGTVKISPYRDEMAEYEAFINEEQQATKVEGLKAKIKEIQEKLDEFNHSANI